MYLYCPTLIQSGGADQDGLFGTFRANAFRASVFGTFLLPGQLSAQCPCFFWRVFSAFCPPGSFFSSFSKTSLLIARQISGGPLAFPGVHREKIGRRQHRDEMYAAHATAINTSREPAVVTVVPVTPCTVMQHSVKRTRCEQPDFEALVRGLYAARSWLAVSGSGNGAELQHLLASCQALLEEAHAPCLGLLGRFFEPALLSQVIGLCECVRKAE